MQDIFDITEKEIQELSDSDLRTLIGLLCEAELERNNLPVTAAKWGGNQRAADGGLDVYVDLENQTEEIGEIPRWKTGIQVKQEKMPKSKIEKEMSLDGTPKPILAELARNKGAYLIACGRDTNSDKMLKERLKAMQDSCESIPEKADLHLDFFDSNRIATWTRKHPSLVLWVKANLGTNSSGWQPHDNWSECPDGIDGEFILDDSSKLYDDRSKNTDGLSAEDGLNRIRTLLHQERSCIRLAGLSGVGKTRFAQALYDKRIGQAPLPKSIACYTDIAHSPSPTPRDMALQLIALNKRAILIMDNCPPDLHDELSKVCTRADSKISLLTIEYDIREDKPERTDVFRMEPSSNDLIEKLISCRFKDINDLEARRIAEFSEGNARIAIALAETFEKGDAILTLENNEIFKRLFHQRNAEDDSLMRAAEVLSLVYSFDGETIGTPESELDKMAELAGISSMDLYRHVNTLLKRGLAQKRSKWRAVLPHAIASRLAKQALDSIPAPYIKNAFDKDGSGRLLKSYTRRLGYLHDSETAQVIVKGWLRPDGWLGNISKLNNLGITLLTNIAPVAQEDSLEAIERAVNGPEGDKFASRDNSHYVELTSLLHKLAYESNLFKRCCRILLKFAAKEDPKENYHSIRCLISSLFRIYRSGTCANQNQRIELLTECVEQNYPFNWIAAHLLEKMLERHQFSLGHVIDFGARTRGYGHQPKTVEDEINWYIQTLEFAQRIILDNGPCSESFKVAIANHFRQLWDIPTLQETLDNFSIQINETKFWKEGWCAIRQTLHFDNEYFDKKSLERLINLEQKLAPTDIYEQAQVYAFTLPWDMIGIDDFSEDRIKKINEYARELGHQVVQNDNVFQKLLPDLVIQTGNIHVFGIGLVKGSNNPTKTWNQILTAFREAPEAERNVTIFSVFLEVMHDYDREWYNATMDNSIEDKDLAPYFPLIQLYNKIDDNAVERLLASLKLKKANIWQYRNLSHGQRSSKINNTPLAHLLHEISKTKDGKTVALSILANRYNHKNDFPLSDKLLKVGQELSLNLTQENIMHTDKHDLREIIKRSFAAAPEKARELCGIIRKDLENKISSWYDYEPFLHSLLEVQPHIVLDEILLKCEHGVTALSWKYSFSKNPILHAPLESVVKWCEIDPETRFPLLAEITPFCVKNNSGEIISTPKLATILLGKANNYPEILKHMEKAIYPSGWSGKLSGVLGQRIPLLKSLQQHEQNNIKEWSASALERLLLRIEKEKNYEANEDRGRHESFE
ncbi:hypothetical protein [Maridesulfovibrio sp.]|uniref:hypothetical protein n=1 Tax=Maridesulfovibrio sp. TaxID=2795000 RepID=UPI0029CA8ED0|nr:hypothetical protein [Maridesulfovibrio sp.]